MNIFVNIAKLVGCKSGIYCIEHVPTGRKYVGRSTNFRQRLHNHKSDMKHPRKDNLLYKAIREHGIEEFSFRILQEAALNLDALEFEWMAKLNSMAPYGFNVGGTTGGLPSQEVMGSMPEELRLYWHNIFSANGRKGLEKLRDLRTNPEYEKEFRKKKSVASTNREANIRVRRSLDPEYDKKMTEIRSAAVKKGYAAKPEQKKKDDLAKAMTTFHRRMKDPEYAAMIRQQRANAARIGWEKKRARQRDAIIS